MEASDLDLTKQYTLADYWSWRFDRMVELVRGFVLPMSPAPAPVHQRVSYYLSKTIGNLLPTGHCELYYAPLDVYLHSTSDPQQPATVIQPDLLIVCDPKKITRRGCEGAPDWIAEILSPGTARYDYDVKFHLYEQAGVQEYWIVDPANNLVETYVLDEGKTEYRQDQVLTEKGQAQLRILPGVSIELEKLFKP